MVPKNKPASDVAFDIGAESMQRELRLRRMCSCGHSAYWHREGGRGDCVHDASCQCRAFRLLSLLSDDAT